MLDYLFQSTVRARLLALLLANPNTEFYVREAARRIKAQPIQVSRELQRAADAGVVVEKRKANLRFYSVNKQNPVFADLKKLFSRAGAGEVLGKELGKLRGIRFVVLFGSAAAGTGRERSDVDLLVVGGVSEDKLLERVYAAEKRLGRELNYLLWNEKELKKKAKEGSHLLKNICVNPLIMIVGDENEFRELAC